MFLATPHGNPDDVAVLDYRLVIKFFEDHASYC